MLLDCYKKLDDDVTDDGSVIKKSGYNCKIIKGSEKNMKITYKNDIKKIKLLI